MAANISRPLVKTVPLTVESGRLATPHQTGRGAQKPLGLGKRLLQFLSGASLSTKPLPPANRKDGYATAPVRNTLSSLANGRRNCVFPSDDLLKAYCTEVERIG
jgi:hypothetical protein